MTASIKRLASPSGEALAAAKGAFSASGNGDVTALFARLNVIDADGDVTLPGAFTEGAPVIIGAYSHRSWTGALPVGKGVISTSGDSAIMTGQFFMTVAEARSTFEVVRELGPLGQWSYGYDATLFEYGDWEGRTVRFLKALTVHEVSPTLVGAGVRTMTLDAKTRAELEAIRTEQLGADGEATAREYARFVRTTIGAGR